MRVAFAASLLVVFCACTPGGVNVVSSGGANVSNVVTIQVSLSAFPAQQTPAGIGLGFSPDLTTIPVGSGVRFMNVDNTVHTATMITGTTFPDKSPFNLSATTPSQVDTLSSTGWSAGNIEIGQTSQTFLVDKPGMYLYGCFYHYSGNMRAEIVAQ